MDALDFGFKAKLEKVDADSWQSMLRLRIRVTQFLCPQHLREVLTSQT